MKHRYQADVPARRIAYFISPHGFGHAARAASVMESLAAIESSLQFDIFTTVPDWFFSQSNSFAFHYHRLETDIGLVQKTPFQEDLPATVQKLNELLPFNQARIAAVAEKIRHLNCKLVICDIAPLGIRVARKAGVPSVLIENFTWDWIYQGYAQEEFNVFTAYLQPVFAEATYHIQTQPICKPDRVDFTAGPASRKIKVSSRQIRQSLRLSDSCKVVMITAGGVPKSYGFIDKLKNQTDTYFIIPGASNSEIIKNNLILLPEDSGYFHPDLINAADAVVGKIGYSTIAEIYQAGVPFAYCARAHYRESKPLVDFVEKHLGGFAIGETEFQAGDWIRRLQDLLALPRIKQDTPNGADQIAGFISTLLNPK
jgi:UDP-N-acetylglucosamine:LPS N-acetylglucosamine transferase